MIVIQVLKLTLSVAIIIIWKTPGVIPYSGGTRTTNITTTVPDGSLSATAYHEGITKIRQDIFADIVGYTNIKKGI